MSDLIDRQEAIDAILAVTGNSSVRELYEHVQEHGLSDMWSGGVNAAIDIIIAVPSVQPEPCEDTISRKAAIDAVRELYIQYPKINNDIVYDTAIDQAHDTLVNLPSAQPQHDISKANFLCPICGAEMEVAVSEWEGEG